MRYLLLTLLIALSSICFGTISIAQTYPVKPIRLIVPFSPGGGSDLIGRIVGHGLSQSFGQQVIVDNRDGLAGSLGSALAAKSPPDGYTLLISDVGTMTVNPWVYKNPGYDPIRQFIHITLATTQPNLMVVSPQVTATTLRDLAVMGKAKSDSFTFAYSAAANQMGGRLFEMLTGAKMTFVPYKGGGPAVTALAGSHVDVMMAGPAALVPFVKAGKIRALAVTGPKRLALLPDVPTSRESGYPEFEVFGWYAVSAPAGTPANIVARLNTEIGRVLTSADVEQKLASQGLQPRPTDVAETARYVQGEYERWGKVVKTARLQPE